MKVLFLTNIPSPYRVDFFQELGKYCDLTVLYEKKSASDRDVNWKREIKEKTYQEIYLKPLISQESSAWCPSVKKYIRDKMYDIIIVGVYSTLTGMNAIWYMKRHKREYFLNCDGGFPAENESWLKKRIKRHLISGASGYLSAGEISDQYLCYYGAIKEKIYRYPFTSMMEADIVEKIPYKDEKRGLKEELGITEEKVILSVGSFIHRKGFDILLKAAGKMDKEYGIYMIGGEPTEEYQKRVDEYHLQHVHFLPFMGKEQLKQYYLAADVFVLPTREDIWGLVINEAMAAGLPVITTDKCGAGIELLGKEYVLHAEEAGKLAEKISNLLCDEQECMRQAERNLQKIKEFTIENMAHTHMEIFERVLNC